MQCAFCGMEWEQPVETLAVCPRCGAPVRKSQVMLAAPVRMESKEGLAEVLIAGMKNLPLTLSQVLSTREHDQKTLSVHLLQGTSDQLAENRSLGYFVFDNIKPAPGGIARIEFVFSITADGLLKTQAHEQGTDHEKFFPNVQLDVVAASD